MARTCHTSLGPDCLSMLGLTRQTAVLAFQFGDGLSNMLIPMSGVFMAMLALARVPYST